MHPENSRNLTFTSYDKISSFNLNNERSLQTLQDWYDGGSSTPTPRIEPEVQVIQAETSSEDRSPKGLSLIHLDLRWFTIPVGRFDGKNRQDIAFEDHKDPTEVSLTEVSLTPSKPQVFAPPVATVAVALPPKTETDTAKPPEHVRLKFEHSQRLKMESKQLFRVLFINMI